MALWSGFCFSGLHLQFGPPGRPLWRWALTILLVQMGFLAIDGTLAALTLAGSLAWMAAPDPGGGLGPSFRCPPGMDRASDPVVGGSSGWEAAVIEADWGG